MKIGIDNYSYHRFFDEIYPGQPAPTERWNLSDFVDHILGMPDLSLVEGLSIETFFLPDDKKKVIRELSRLNLPLVFQWGHPNGFMDISFNQINEQIITSLELSSRFDCKIMRIVASSIKYINQPHQPQIDHALRCLEKILPLAQSYNVMLALENHGDFYLSEMQTILEKNSTPYLGTVIDTGNYIRINENPREAISIFGERVYLVHAKDLAILSGRSGNDPLFYGCVPAGMGMTDFSGIFDDLQQLAYSGFIFTEISRMHPLYELMGEIEMIRNDLHYLHALREERRSAHATSRK